MHFSTLRAPVGHCCPFAGDGQISDGPEKAKRRRNAGAVSEVPPSEAPFKGGLKGLGAKGGDEGLKVEGGFTFGRLQRGFKGA